MYALSLIGKHKMSFSKHFSLTDAKKTANEKLAENTDWLCGRFDYATIYNQEDKTTIRKDRGHSGWFSVVEE